MTETYVLSGIVIVLLAALLILLLEIRNGGGAMLEEFSRMRREFGELGSGLRGDLQQGLRTQLEQQREEARALETRLFDLRSEMEAHLERLVQEEPPVDCFAGTDEPLNRDAPARYPSLQDRRADRIQSRASRQPPASGTTRHQRSSPARAGVWQRPRSPRRHGRFARYPDSFASPRPPSAWR